MFFRNKYILSPFFRIGLRLFLKFTYYIILTLRNVILLRGGMVPALVDGTKGMLSIIEGTAVREDSPHCSNNSASVGGI